MASQFDLINWLSSYLETRIIKVKVNGFYSNWFILNRRVPLGSSLGPILFLANIDDLIHKISCQKLLFADDLKLFHKISSLKDNFELQANINIVYTWAIQNSMIINQTKMNVESYTRKKSFISFNYYLKYHLIMRVNYVKNLGVFFDHKLTFDMHVSYLIKNGNKALGLIK